MNEIGHGGHRPGAGRPKGAKNKSTIARAALVELFEQRKYNPINELIDAATDFLTPPKTRAGIHRHLLRLATTARIPSHLLKTLLPNGNGPE